ncbi:Amino-terminal enhancer of split, partial [Larimichthys crocea]
YYEMSYGLNIEMHKQAEIVKRLNAICAQVIPFLSQERAFSPPYPPGLVLPAYWLCPPP